MTNDSSQSPGPAIEPRAGAESPAPHDDALARTLRGFGPLGVLAALVILALGSLGGLPVLLWARLSHTPWRDLGFVRPRNWPLTIVTGVVVGCAFKILMKAIVMPLLGADPVNHAYHYLEGNPAALQEMIFMVIIGAGFGEETVFRGFLFERLGRLFGRGRGAKIAIVLITSALFAVAHVPGQGWTGAEQAAITGLAFATFFAVTGELAPLMIAHAAFDLFAVAIIYMKLETVVAHLVFK